MLALRTLMVEMTVDSGMAHAVSQWGATLAPDSHREFGVADECPDDAADWTGAAVIAEVAERLIGGRRRCSLHSLPLTRCEAATETRKQVSAT
jgi:hypothetical protein